MHIYVKQHPRDTGAKFYFLCSGKPPASLYVDLIRDKPSGILARTEERLFCCQAKASGIHTESEMFIAALKHNNTQIGPS